MNADQSAQQQGEHRLASRVISRVSRGVVQPKGRNDKLLARVATLLSSVRHIKASEQNGEGRAGATGFDQVQAH
jgi:hypothetical protein